MLPIPRLFSSAVQPQSAGIAARVERDLATGARQIWIRDILEVGGDRVSERHLWRVGPAHFGAIISLLRHDQKPPAQ